MADAILTWKCAECNLEKPRASFIGVLTDQSKCEICLYKEEQAFQYEEKRNYRLKKMYGITSAQFEELVRFQGNTCAICHTSFPRGKYNVWCVDHCHVTGRVRGILCHKCNSTLAAMGDDVPGVLRFLHYLQGSNPIFRKSTRLPYKHQYTVFRDANGRVTKSSTPGAVKERKFTKYYYGDVYGRRTLLYTMDFDEAIKRLEKLRSTSPPLSYLQQRDLKNKSPNIEPTISE